MDELEALANENSMRQMRMTQQGVNFPNFNEIYIKLMLEHLMGDDKQMIAMQLEVFRKSVLDQVDQQIARATLLNGVRPQRPEAN